ncbi:hypothetical protein EYF80_055879 [Liparis tanakae]|uniref:Uncharacterized protein n=1 Tax=Liparis tanakae TaxID=230148 RepID=A0A4Z2EYW3_9TELE|nr:hypothetical protein EYF80_055879 [Liparis tanakae]
MMSGSVPCTRLRPLTGTRTSGSTGTEPGEASKWFGPILRRGRRTSLSEGENARQAAQRTPEEEEEAAEEEEEGEENTTPKQRIRCIERRVDIQDSRALC